MRLTICVLYKYMLVYPSLYIRIDERLTILVIVNSN